MAGYFPNGDKYRAREGMFWYSPEQECLISDLLERFEPSNICILQIEMILLSATNYREMTKAEIEVDLALSKKMLSQNEEMKEFLLKRDHLWQIDGCEAWSSALAKIGETLAFEIKGHENQLAKMSRTKQPVKIKQSVISGACRAWEFAGGSVDYTDTFKAFFDAVSEPPLDVHKLWNESHFHNIERSLRPVKKPRSNKNTKA